MIKVYPDTKIYVHCPAGVVTGGAELLHQLVGFLRDNGKNAYIVYFGNVEHKVPSDYSRYNIAMEENIVDDAHNVEILYEGIFNMIHHYKKIQKFFWWISVDNFYICAQNYLSLHDLYQWNKNMWRNMFKKRTRVMLQGHRPLRGWLTIKEMIDMGCVCGYQAEYIQHFLQKCGFNEIVPLKDYVNTDHCVSFSKADRDDVIVYNPRKGLVFTQKLISISPELTWIPLENMNRQQLIETIRRAKVYVDFGYHPGKDRLPRECAMNGCCIITGKRGSAAFFEDVAIPSQYKFEEKELKPIIEKIKLILSNYEDAINDFDFYRRRIMKEKEEFENQIKDIFLRN